MNILNTSFSYYFITPVKTTKPDNQHCTFLKIDIIQNPVCYGKGLSRRRWGGTAWLKALMCVYKSLSLSLPYIQELWSCLVGPHFLMLGCKSGEQECQSDDLDWVRKKLLTSFIRVLAQRLGGGSSVCGGGMGEESELWACARQEESLFCLLCWGLSDRHRLWSSLRTFPRLTRKRQEKLYPLVKASLGLRC